MAGPKRSLRSYSLSACDNLKIQVKLTENQLLLIILPAIKDYTEGLQGVSDHISLSGCF
jgi:hypothetical protein